MSKCNGTLLVTLAFATSIHGVRVAADIVRWDTGALIPGTAGLVPGPGAQLDNRVLEYANLENINLANARFDFSILSNAHLHGSNLSSASFQGANLTDAAIYGARLTNTTFTGANISRADFYGTTSQVFTEQQLLSTSNYQSKNLQGIRFGGNDVSGWNFAGQDLTNTDFTSATVTNANFSQATVNGTIFLAVEGLSKSQIYSTASYQQKTLQQISLAFVDFSNGEFSDQNLTGARLDRSNFTTANFQSANLTDATFFRSQLTGTNLQGAIVTGTSFLDTTSRGFTQAQLESTASFQSRDMHGVNLQDNDLRGWNFRGQNVAGADFTGSRVDSAVFDDAIIEGGRVGNLTRDQIYSTASYKQKNLQRIWMPSANLSGWDLSGQNLFQADLYRASLNDANLEGVNLANADLILTTFVNADLTGADLRGAYFDNFNGAKLQNAILPSGQISGLDLMAGRELVVRNYHGYSNAGIGPRPVVVQNSMLAEVGGTLQISFDADVWDSIIKFQEGIPVSLGGRLELTFAPHVNVPGQIGRTLRVFDWTGVTPTGAFQLTGPYIWNTDKLYSAGEVTLLAVPEPSTPIILVALIALPLAGSRRSVM